MKIDLPVTGRNHAILKTENDMGKFVQEQLIPEKILHSVGTLARSVFP